MGSDNCPMMGTCDESRAPWNDKENDDVELRVDVEYTLVKTNMRVNTNKYELGYEDGGSYVDTSTIDFDEVYEDNHYTIIEMLNELKNYVEEDMKNCAPNSGKYLSLKRLLDDCQGWHVDGRMVQES